LKLYPGEYTIMDLLAVSRSPAFRTAVTPFGPDAMYHRYAGRAVAWKMNFNAAPERVKSGLSKAISISKGAAGVRGVALVSVDGKTMLVPKKVVEQLRAAGKRPVILAERATASEIITGVRAAAMVG